MDRKYCPSCGQEVPLERTLQGNYLMIACKNCGLGLGVKLASADELRRLSAPEQPSLARVEVVKRSRTIAAAVEKPAPPDPRSAAPRDIPPPAPATPSAPPADMEANLEAMKRATEGGPVRQMNQVMLAEDSQFLRQITRDLLLSQQLAREVVDCEDGVAFVEAYTRALVDGNRPDLVVLDVRMPGLDGQRAAFAMRAVETAMGQKRTPILFFSSVLCDEPFKAILKELGNARYIRKSDDGDAQVLGERIVSVLGRLVGAR